MPFILVIAILFILLVIAVNPRSWGEWAKEGWTDLMVLTCERNPSDIEIRAVYRKRDMQDVPFVKPGDTIKYPDPVLDKLINEERFNEANNYRMKRLMEARESRDRDSLENYIVYNRVLSTAVARADERTRKALRQKYPKIQKKDAEVLLKIVDRIGFPQITVSHAVTLPRSRFLEIEERSSNENGFEDLISV